MQMYKGYNILNKSVNRDNLSSMLKVLSRAKDTMVNPRMMHFISEIVDPEQFPSKFIQTFKEKFESEVNARNRQRKLEWKQKQKTATEKKYFQERKIPKIEIIYSIESSWKDAPHPDENLAEHGEMIKVDYLHIHMMVIIDVGYNDYGYTELMICTNKSISRISGLQQVNYDGFTCYKDGKENHYGFFKPRDKKSTIKKGEYLNSYWHDLKLEFEDAVIRASYLCKTTQKVRLPEIFKRGNSFNISRPSRSAVKDILQAA